MRLAPSLDDVQRAINRSAVAVLGCAKRVSTGASSACRTKGSRVFFDRLGRDTEIVKIALLLTGALHATKNQVQDWPGPASQAFKHDLRWMDRRERA